MSLMWLVKTMFLFVLSSCSGRCRNEITVPFRVQFHCPGQLYCGKDGNDIKSRFPEYMEGRDTPITPEQLATRCTIKDKAEGVILSSGAIPVRTSDSLESFVC